MTNFAHGQVGEAKAADYLIAKGFKLIDRNWKTKYCEIDIIARKDKAIYFVEVKYRQTDKQGTGLDYITPKKVKQMSFAAEMWVGNNNWLGEYCLAAIAVNDNEITFVEL